MTQDEIIEIAREAGFVVTHIGDPIGTNYTMIEAFANLVAEKAVRESSAEYRLGWNDGQIAEREACAKLVDEEALDAYTFDDSLARATEGYARLIRARGEQA
jgi:hypothetical protein